MGPQRNKIGNIQVSCSPNQSGNSGKKKCVDSHLYVLRSQKQQSPHGHQKAGFKTLQSGRYFQMEENCEENWCHTRKSKGCRTLPDLLAAAVSAPSFDLLTPISCKCPRCRARASPRTPAASPGQRAPNFSHWSGNSHTPQNDVVLHPVRSGIKTGQAQ